MTRPDIQSDHAFKEASGAIQEPGAGFSFQLPKGFTREELMGAERARLAGVGGYGAVEMDGVRRHAWGPPEQQIMQPANDAMEAEPKPISSMVTEGLLLGKKLAPEIREKDFSNITHYARRMLEGRNPEEFENALNWLANGVNDELTLRANSPLRVRILLDKQHDDFVIVVRDESNHHYGRMIIAQRKSPMTPDRIE